MLKNVRNLKEATLKAKKETLNNKKLKGEKEMLSGIYRDCCGILTTDEKTFGEENAELTYEELVKAIDEVDKLERWIYTDFETFESILNKFKFSFLTTPPWAWELDEAWEAVCKKIEEKEK